MRRLLLAAFVAALCAVCWSEAKAHDSELPILSLNRVAWGLRGGYQWQTSVGETPLWPHVREPFFGLGGAYFLTKNASFIYSVDIGADNKIPIYQVGVHFTLYNGLAHR